MIVTISDNYCNAIESVSGLEGYISPSSLSLIAAAPRFADLREVDLGFGCPGLDLRYLESLRHLEVRRCCRMSDVMKFLDKFMIFIYLWQSQWLYSLGRQLVEKVLLYGFCKFSLLAWAAWQLQYSPTAWITL